MAKKKREKCQLKVIFDTNALYTQLMSDLVKNDVRNFIQKYTDHNDLIISWIFPRPVVDERRYQMQKKAFEHIPALERLEKLLGHKLGISEDVLTERVNSVIDKQLRELGIISPEINSDEVDWADIVNRSIYRKPPFDGGEKEKGFRDAVIAQTVLQTLECSPKTPSICRVVLITDDKLVIDYVIEKTETAKNLKILSSLDELEGLINTISSELPEDFLDLLLKKATTIFFEKENKGSLYYKDDVRKKINELYSEHLKITPEPGQIRENGTWWIKNSIFSEKSGNKITWTTPVTIEGKLFALLPSTAQTNQQQTQEAETAQTILTKALLKLNESLQKKEVGKIETTFHIKWTTTLSQTDRLTSPMLKSIDFVETEWDDNSEL